MKYVWQILAVVAVAAAGGQAAAAVEDNPWLTLVVGLLAAGLSILVYRWIVGRTERREVTELAKKDVAAPVFRGTLVGIATFAAVMLNLYWLDHLEFDGMGSVSGAFGQVGLMAAAAVTEELIFRGLLLRLIERRLGSWIALSVTAVLFGLMHMANENATLFGALAIAVEAGCMLGAAYLATRSLWLPIGLHFGWNFAEGGIFSAAVSGNSESEGLLETAISGPQLLTGGEFGPEASLYSILFCSVLTVAFLLLARRRGLLIPRRRRAEASAPVATLDR